MKINYHGGGYVGLTGAFHYARAGYDVVITDPDESVVGAINSGNPKAGMFLDYLGVLSLHERLHAQTTIQLDADAHLIAVPSEKNGMPFMDIVLDLFGRLCQLTNSLVPIIVESTVMPGIASKLRTLAASIGEQACYRPWAIAPRRDWFADADKNLHTLTRIVGRDEWCHNEISPLFENVCRDIRWTSPETAEITKALENALLHVPVVLLHELALLYPEYDIVEAAELASTHWRFKSMGKLYIGLGTGGRCVPVGSKYLSERGGALLGDALEIDEQFALGALDEILGISNVDAAPGLVLVLGIAYRPGFKDAGNSPGLRVAVALDRFSPDVFDPYFTREETRGLLAQSGMKTSAVCKHIEEVAFPYDLIVLTVAHPEFADVWQDIKPGTTVIDATGMWEGKRDDIHYIRPGRPGWITEKRSQR